MLLVLLLQDILGVIFFWLVWNRNWLNYLRGGTEMAIRKALSYSKKINRPYTRVSKVKSRAYIKVVPPNKVVKYNLGNQRAFDEGRFPFILRMISDETLVIRDLSIESARMVLTKNLEEKILGKFYLWVKIYPHHILRNNKAAAGAGADRDRKSVV